MDLSFSGAGFMGCYYFGVVNAWNKYIPRERVRRVAGASAGSLIAAYYLMDLPLSDCLGAIIEMTEDMRRRPLGVFDRSNQMVDVLPRLLDRLFPEDAHKRVNGRLFVSMTRLRDMKSVIVNQFESKADLIEALNCSCFIPVWSGNHVSTFRGLKYIDGGFSNNLPAFDEHTIRVCSFAGPSDIAPYDRQHSELLRGSIQGMPVYLTWKNMGRAKQALWPPPPAAIIELLERGFRDAKNFILSNDLIQCSRCFGKLEESHQPIYTRLKLATISPAPSASVSRASSFMNLAQLGCEPADEGPAGGPDASGQPEPRQRRASSASSSESAAGSLDSATSSGVFSSAAQEEPVGKPALGLARALRSRLGPLRRALRPRKEAPSGLQLAPSIVVHQPADEEQQADSAGSSPRKPARPEPPVGAKLGRAHALRRDSLPLGEGASPIDRFVRRQSASPEALEQVAERLQSKLAALSESAAAPAAGKFQLAGGSSLPDCPPSPLLNRHCPECIQMRQQARADLIDEQIIEQARLYRNMNAGHQPEREFAQLASGGSIGGRLSGWLRQLAGQKTRQAYQFEDELEGGEALGRRRASVIPSLS